jgi:hypothetical protein
MPPTGHVTRTAAKSPKASTRPSAAPSASQAFAWTTSKQNALVSALGRMAAAGRASVVTGAVREATSLISDNGLGILSNNSGGYRVLAATPPTVVETESLVYVIAVDETGVGDFHTYDKARYAATPEAERAGIEVDYFTIDQVDTVIHSKDTPITIDATYHLTVKRSKRLPFSTDQGLTAKQTYTITPVGEEMKESLTGWEIAFDMVVPQLDGQSETSHFKAVAGQDDIALFPTSDGDTLGIPKSLAVTGENASGQFEGRMEGADHPVTEVSFEATASHAKSHLTLQTQADGTTERTVALDGEQLKLTMTQAADGTGTGQLFDTSGAAPKAIGTLAWDPDGVGTVTLTTGAGAGKGTPFKVRLF